MGRTLNAIRTLTVGDKSYDYYSIEIAGRELGADFTRLPYSMKVLLENLIRYEDGVSVDRRQIQAVADWMKERKSAAEIAYRPARVLMQDFTGVPAVVDLAAMRDAVQKLGGDPRQINPLAPVDLVIDHSVMVDYAGQGNSFQQNVALEMDRNKERYQFLRWGQRAFDNFRVVPPGTGICHQVNLEYLAKVVWTKDTGGRTLAYPDTLVGTDSHTTMVNGLAVLGWGVGGIEAEAAMLGQPVSMLIPEVIGFRLTGKLKEGRTATDLVLTVTQMLRAKGVVNKFVEFYGPGLDELGLADRATIANMAPEYGATCGFFPIDNETIRYLRLSGRDEAQISLVEAYAKAQGMWRTPQSAEPIFTESLELDLSTVEPCIAGPKRPQDRINLKEAANSFVKLFDDASKVNKSAPVEGKQYQIKNGSVVIAAITSCTNTSNPNVLVAAGLVARKAAARGLTSKPWVKTSLAPGSQVVSEYLQSAGLQKDLDALGFNLVGYGCTTCIGNSRPLDSAIEQSVKDNDLIVASVLSGNRNFEGRVHASVKANYLMSPPLVVAYAIAGDATIDLTTQPLGKDSAGNDVYLKDIWPTQEEIATIVSQVVTPEMFRAKYADVFKGTPEWQAIPVTEGLTYNWDNTSTYIQNPPYFENMRTHIDGADNVADATILALFGDSITTDHISPAGNISATSPAAQYLNVNGVDKKDFNSYGARRGNHEVMMRGTFANIRIKNEILGGKEGGYTKYIPTSEEMSIYDAAMRYKQHNTPLVIFAGKEYGTGSSRDWAAKGTYLLGVKAVVAESFERIHRSNLVGMGVLPLQFKPGHNRQTLKLDGSEIISITGLSKGITPKMDVMCTIVRKNAPAETIPLLCRIDTIEEVQYFLNGGILHNVIRHLTARAAA